MSDIDNTPQEIDGGDVDWKATAETLQARVTELEALQYPRVDGDFLQLGPEIFTKVDDQSAIMYKGVAYGIKQADPQPKDLKKYSIGEVVEVQKNGMWMPGRVSSRDAATLNVDTERGPVPVMSYHIIRKAPQNG